MCLLFFRLTWRLSMCAFTLGRGMRAGADEVEGKSGFVVTVLQSTGRRSTERTCWKRTDPSQLACICFLLPTLAPAPRSCKHVEKRKTAPTLHLCLGHWGKCYITARKTTDQLQQNRTDRQDDYYPPHLPRASFSFLYLAHYFFFGKDFPLSRRFDFESVVPDVCRVRTHTHATSPSAIDHDSRPIWKQMKDCLLGLDQIHTRRGWRM